MSMMMTLLAAALTCLATTDIPEFKDKIQGACEQPCPDGGCIAAVSFTGNHDSARILLTYVDSWRGRQIAGPVYGARARGMAVQVNKILQPTYPMKRFEYAIRDSTSEVDVCTFVFEADASNKWLPTKATCLVEVP
jgi:hypothetical protein